MNRPPYNARCGNRPYESKREAHCARSRCIIQQRAGHVSITTTQRYIEVTPDQERRALRVIKF